MLEAKTKKYTAKELKEVLELHKTWLTNVGGARANLSDADLSYADLSYANLSYANLRGADLSYANLSYANLSYANLSYANLSYANLSDANLRGADLRGANLRGANLRGANLSDANLSDANLSDAVGEKEYIKSLQVEKYHISYTDTVLNIGCQSHLITEWTEFSDEKISKMDSGALGWWKVWKPIIMNIIEVSPAKKQKTKEKK